MGLQVKILIASLYPVILLYWRELCASVGRVQDSRAITTGDEDSLTKPGRKVKVFSVTG
jgi:hypothetical protein